MEKYKAFLVSIGVAGLGVLSGCMSQRVNLVKAGVVSIDTDTEERMRLFPAVYEEDGRLIVSGTARPRWPALYILGHIDITVTGPDGTILEAQHVPYRNQAPGRQLSAKFRAVFPMVPPAGSVIQVRHHVGAHTQTGRYLGRLSPAGSACRPAHYGSHRGDVWQAGSVIFTRLLDGVDPEVIDKITHAAQHTPGVQQVTEVRARWLGHRLHAEVNVTVDGALSVQEGHTIATAVRHQLLHHVPYLSQAIIHVDPLHASGEVFHRIADHAHEGEPLHRHP